MKDPGRKLRHCMIVYAPYPHSETRVRREAEALVAAGFEVDVICPRTRNDESSAQHRGVTIYRVPQKWTRKKNLLAQTTAYMKFFTLASVRLLGLHLKRKYDVIQAHNVPDFLVFTALIPRLTGSKVILDLHDLMPEFYRGRLNNGRGALLPVIRLQEGLSCRFAHHVITVTDHWRQALVERGVPAGKVSVLMNVPDAAVFHPPPSGNATKKDPARFSLFYHGYIPERYGLDLVLKAMNGLRSRIPGIHLTLVGGGEHVKKLKLMAAELRLEVDFVHSVEAEALPPLIAAADVGVVPYRNDIFTDSLLPTKLMEYAALGLPSIAARTTGISSYFNDSMVEFFTPGDVADLSRCILSLYSDTGRRRQLAQGISEFHRRYNWGSISTEYVSLVENLGCCGRIRTA